MSRDDLRQTILDALVEVAPEVDVITLDPAHSFRDQTEMDSIDFLNFVLALERRLGVKIPENDYPRLSSLGGCERYLAKTA